MGHRTAWAAPARLKGGGSLPLTSGPVQAKEASKRWSLCPAGLAGVSVCFAFRPGLGWAPRLPGVSLLLSGYVTGLSRAQLDGHGPREALPLLAVAGEAKGLAPTVGGAAH